MGPIRICGGLWGLIGIYGDLWGPIGTYGDLWWPMGTLGGPWGPIGPYGGLWGPLETHWHLSRPVRTYRGLWERMGMGASSFCTPILTPTPLPLPPSIRSISDISHILLYTLQKQHAISDIRHQTLYTILGVVAPPWAVFVGVAPKVLRAPLVIRQRCLGGGRGPKALARWENRQAEGTTPAAWRG